MSGNSIASGNLTGMAVFNGLAADELNLYATGTNPSVVDYQRSYQDNLTPISPGKPFNIWRKGYNAIFVANSAIEGINASKSLTPAVKQQLLGEAKFMRAYWHFYLANIFGDVPLALTTDFKVTGNLPRIPKTQVYQQVIADLKDAQDLLNSNYLGADLLNTTDERVRPTKWAAMAVLAKVYLYAGDNVNAEVQATGVIDNNSLFSLAEVPLNRVFLKNSRETIWALQPVNNGYNSNTLEGLFYVLPEIPSSSWIATLSNNIVSRFETGDLRRTSWVDSVQQGGQTYYYPNKYKIGHVNTDVQEYPIQLRLAEQYLIRAEARARQGKLTGANSAVADLNIIRARAGLAGTSANSQTALFDAILAERRSELFTEGGNRWFDLQRFGKIDSVMGVVAPQKGGIWAPYKALAPIAQSEIDRNPSLQGHQNPGY
jgi:hypothetical protein